MRRLITILLFIFTFICQNSFAQTPILRRVCINVNNNNLFWTNPTFSCSDFKFYLIWGRNGNSGPFVFIDTVKNIAGDNYTHVNANIGSGSPNWFYFIERRDSCGPLFNHYSDTLRIDEDATEQTFFDSVSVDILTNQVQIGWPSNKSADFNRYFVFLFTSTYTSLTPAGIKDTFFTDVINNPSSGVLSYDIYTTDSCGNPSLLGLSKHSTIFLQNTIDTCKREYRLSWSHYVGWKNIKQYYIFRKTGSSQFILIDSVIGSMNTYIGKYSPGINYELFVRAIKDSAINITSSSNKIQFITPPRKDPSYISINFVSSRTPISDNLSLSFSAEGNNDVSGYVISVYDTNFNLIETLNLKPTDIDRTIPLSQKDNQQYLFVTAATNYCGNVFFYGDTSTNIVLTGTDISGVRSLTWNPYFTWNSGVEKYQISRGTGADGVFQLSPWLSITDTLIKDSQIIEEIKNEGVCYYIEAIELVNAIGNIARSNMLCLSTGFLVFVPNAFVPDGINNLFRPEGSSIDYTKSTITIYNRWGEEVYSGVIGNGWGGLDSSGQICSSGVYHYNLEIISSENEKRTKNGIVTLLR